MTKQEKADFKEVEKAYNQLRYTFSSIAWGKYFENTCDILLDEERRHRKSWESLPRPGMTKAEAVQYFAVKWFLDYYSGEYKPTLRDVLHLKPSCVAIATLCANYPEEIAKAFNGEAMPGKRDFIDIAKIKGLDYCEMMKEACYHTKESGALCTI